MPSLFRDPNDPSSSVESSSDVSHVRDNGPSSDAGPTKLGSAASEGMNNGPKSSPRALARAISSAGVSQLPNLKQHQHQSLLQMALIEQHCRTQAAKALNEGLSEANKLSEDHEEVLELAGRLYADMSNLFGHTADLPNELLGPEGKPLRDAYRSNLDAILNKAATRVARGLEAFSNSSEDVGRTKAPVNSTRRGSPALASIGMHQITGALDEIMSNSAPSLMLGQSKSFFGTKSTYLNEYQEISPLGKGGYGQVWRVRNHLDNQEYAIKKIVITSQKLHKSRENQQIEALLAELRTLARLFHTNIVRYHHGWVEASSTTSKSDPIKSQHQNLLSAPSISATSAGQTYESDDALIEEDWNRGIEHGMDPNMQLMYERQLAEEEYDDGIIFGDPSRSQSHSVNLRDRRPSHATTSSTFTVKTSVKSLPEEEEDDDVETVPRNDGPRGSAAVPQAQDNQAQYDGPDIILYIQMSLHPATLASYLSPDTPKAEDAVKLRHCYHQDTSIAILKAILDGIEYLHSQKIVHRDLKPANIFLSVHHDQSPSPHGCINISACSQCPPPSNGEAATAVYITPCIGDFGLIAEMRDAPAGAGSDTYEPSPLAHLSPRPVGTQLYRPARMPAREPRICPKLDVYSLGVIAFELLWRFGTRAERALLLTDLAKGILPPPLEHHPMAPGIRAMVCQDRDQRWDCAAVRRWLDGLEHGSQGTG
ncbi:MAG: hypothetical protein M1818_001164 [Claussenomyces sp. TS43310]|nr:MAG: hypothetical protein M1818_001164 [Claussenomyces sp. TS43310]